MNNMEILRQAELMLPDINTFENDVVLVPVIKPLYINNKITPQSSSYYVVRFKKVYNYLNKKLNWVFINIDEY